MGDGGSFPWGGEVKSDWDMKLTTHLFHGVCRANFSCLFPPHVKTSKQPNTVSTNKSFQQSQYVLDHG